MVVNDAIKKLQEIKEEFGEHYELHIPYANRGPDSGTVSAGSTYSVRKFECDKYSSRITMS